MDIKIGPRTKNLIGETFNKLTVIAPSEKDLSGSVRWVCKCDCGNTITVLARSIVRGHTKSCGCIKSESIRESQTTHGLSNTRQYKTWASMMRRCYTVSEKAYPRYGGRGIRVCDEWHDFKNFWKDMGGSYGATLTLERIDINKDYCPENCEWATMQKQSMNRGTQSNNVLGIANIKVINNDSVAYLRGTLKNPLTKKTITRTLKIDKYGYDVALEIIKEWLKDKRKEFGYGQSHGDIRINVAG